MRSFFFFKRAYVNFLRNRYNNISSVVNVAVVSFFSVLILFIIENSIEFLEHIISENSAAIVLREPVSESEIMSIDNFLKNQKGIESYKYIPPSAAYQELKRVFSLSAESADISPDEILPHLFELKFSRYIDSVEYDKFISELKKNSGFGDIKVNTDLMNLSFKVRKFSIYFKGIIFLIVCISSFYILSNTIGLNLNNNRREEIELVELLGGDYMDIKMPYVLEGMAVISIGFILGISVAFAVAIILLRYAGRILNSGVVSFDPVMLNTSEAILLYAILTLSGLFGVVRFINRFIKGLYEEDIV